MGLSCSNHVPRGSYPLFVTISSDAKFSVGGLLESCLEKVLAGTQCILFLGVLKAVQMCQILYNQRRSSSPMDDLSFSYFLVGQAVVSRDEQLRDHVNDVLRGGDAHLNFDRAIDGLPVALRGVTPAGLRHSAWQLVEHLRICQWDILEYSLDGRHESPDFPDGYWPIQAAPPTEDAWDRSVAAFRSDLKAMQSLVGDPSTDLFAPIPYGQAGHTILREALLVADHNAYHLGQLVMVRRALGDWQD